jgi:hypothetical protein
MGAGPFFLVAVLALGQRAIPLGEDESPRIEEPPRVSRPAWVVTDGLPVLVEPEVGAFVTARLKAGRKVIVRSSSPPGWLAIVPPADSFSWIEKETIEDLGEGLGRVVVSAAAVRPGRNDVSLPAGPWVTLRAGTEVALLDRPPLVLRQGGSRRVWYAIEPPACEVRYISAEGVAWSDPGAFDSHDDTDDPPPRLDFLTSGRGRTSDDRLGRIDPEFVAVGPVAREVGLSAPFEVELKRVEREHRALLARPLESWALEPIEAAYTQLRDQTSIANERQAIALRLEQLRRQAEAAKTARSLRELLEQSKQRDREFDRIRARLGTIAGGDEGPYDAEGLLQPSSTLLDGRKACVLIDDSGKIDAYLLMPPGVRPDEYLSARVGIRGDSRYNAQLKARVITVREVDRLDASP